MSQFKTVMIILVPAAVLLFAFQNCSQTRFAGTDSASSVGAMAGTDPVATLPDVPSGTTPADTTSTNTTTPDTTSTDPGTTTTNPPTETSHSGGQCSNQGSNPGSNQGNSGAGETGSGVSTSGDATYYRGLCAKAAKSKWLVQVADGLNISQHSGVVRYKAASFGRIEDVAGETILFNSSAQRGHIDTIRDVSGNMILCGFDIAEIDGRSGSLIVVDGNIGSLSNSAGIVVVVGGKIKSLGNYSGKIREI